MFFEICLMLLVIYSFISQIILLFSHTFQFGIRSLSSYPAAVEQDHASRLQELVATNLSQWTQVVPPYPNWILLLFGRWTHTHRNCMSLERMEQERIILRHQETSQNRQIWSSSLVTCKMPTSTPTGGPSVGCTVDSFFLKMSSCVLILPWWERSVRCLYPRNDSQVD